MSLFANNLFQSLKTQISVILLLSLHNSLNFIKCTSICVCMTALLTLQNNIDMIKSCKSWTLVARTNAISSNLAFLTLYLFQRHFKQKDLVFSHYIYLVIPFCGDRWIVLFSYARAFHSMHLIRCCTRYFVRLHSDSFTLFPIVAVHHN